MSKMTKAQLEQENEDMRKTLASLEKKVAKVVKKAKTTEKVEIALSETQWQTIAGHFGKQISLCPFKAGGKYPTPALNMKATFSATKSGIDEARALLDIAENKLKESGLLTQ